MRYQAALHSVGGDAVQSAKQNHTTPMAQCRLLGSYPVRDPRSRQTVIAARSTAAGCIKTLVNQPFPSALVVPSVRLELTLILKTQRVCLSRHEGCMLLSFVFAGNLLPPPPITKVYHKQTSAVCPKRGLLHPFKSRPTSSSTSVFVTRCLYVEILAGWLNPTDMSEIGA